MSGTTLWYTLTKVSTCFINNKGVTVLAERIHLQGAFGGIYIRCSDDEGFYKTKVHVHDNQGIAQKLGL
jgi:hypothetical protein